MELIIEEKKIQPVSYEGILKNMNLKVIDGKLSQDNPIKKNVYFYPQELNISPSETNSNKNNSSRIQPLTLKQQYIKYLVQKINQKKRVSQIKSKKMYFV
jgi:hypothetical protein